MKNSNRFTASAIGSRLPLSLTLTLLILQGCGSSRSSPEPDPPREPTVVYSDGFLQSFTDLYAEEFDEDTLYVQSFKFYDSTGSSSAAVTDDAIVLSASSDGTGYANRYIRFNESADSVVLSATIDEQTSLPASSESAAFVSLMQHFSIHWRTMFWKEKIQLSVTSACSIASGYSGQANPWL